MMNTGSFSFGHDMDLTGVCIRALRSLRPEDVDVVRKTLAPVASNWSVQSFDDYDGYLAIIVEPKHDPEATAFVLSGTTEHLQLAEMRDDNLQTLANFGTIAAAADQLASVIGLS